MHSEPQRSKPQVADSLDVNERTWSSEFSSRMSSGSLSFPSSPTSGFRFERTDDAGAAFVAAASDDDRGEAAGLLLLASSIRHSTFGARRCLRRYPRMSRGNTVFSNDSVSSCRNACRSEPFRAADDENDAWYGSRAAIASWASVHMLLCGIVLTEQ